MKITLSYHNAINKSHASGVVSSTYTVDWFGVATTSQVAGHHVWGVLFGDVLCVSEPLSIILTGGSATQT